MAGIIAAGPNPYAAGLCGKSAESRRAAARPVAACGRLLRRAHVDWGRVVGAGALAAAAAVAAVAAVAVVTVVTTVTTVTTGDGVMAAAPAAAPERSAAGNRRVGTVQ
ncbi:hypothetical protein [Burkholderia multivorans]|uniref:hypothetical protein n=1 Tax=Burkholderia multivorans TaxID=87883 RepID=UPI00286FC368|nr:hypothetical protein [Burkholderia multivorans]HEM7850566.1 hypothetical protein [Burkholderia multivorans]